LIGPPRILFEPHIATDIILTFNEFTRIYWVIGFVLIWYTYTFFTEILREFDLRIAINVIYDPCWLDVDSIYTLYQYAYDLCSNITDYGNRMSYTSKQINYYKTIEESYVGQKQVYHNSTITIDDHDIYYNWSCDYRTLVDELNPVQQSFSFYSLLIDTGVLTALLIEPIIAELLKSLFTIYNPLCVNRGNMLVPDEFYLNDETEETLIASEKSLMKNLSGYLRFNAFVKSLVYIAILIFLFINVSDYKSL